jgi:hypothetical protein
MTYNIRACARTLVFTLAFVQAVETTSRARAQDRTRRVRPPVVVARARPCAVPPTTLGTFFPSPVITVRGNDPLGGGYSPLGIYGDQTMSLYGPLSPLRVTAAPVVTYVRGYDGQVRLTRSVSFSNPNLPALSPVMYPTEANYFYGPRVSRTPPWGSNAINWIDQN